jgi:ArsR family transcriptional regulator
MDDMTIDCVEFCKALADDTRQQILVLLLEREMSVGEIVDAFTMSQPTISHHLNVLRRYGLVTIRREGQQVFYAINQNNVVTCCGRLVAKFDSQEVEETNE